MKPLFLKLANFVAYDVAWFALVLSAAAGRSWLGLAVAALVLAAHFEFVPRRVPEAKLVVAAAAIGLAWDSALVVAGLASYAGAGLLPGLVPLWMVALWATFATTLNLALAPLKSRPWLAAVVGAVAGPLAYWAGVRLGAIETDALTGLLVAQGIG